MTTAAGKRRRNAFEMARAQRAMRAFLDEHECRCGACGEWFRVREMGVCDPYRGAVCNPCLVKTGAEAWADVRRLLDRLEGLSPEAVQRLVEAEAATDRGVQIALMRCRGCGALSFGVMTGPFPRRVGWYCPACCDAYLGRGWGRADAMEFARSSMCPADGGGSDWAGVVSGPEGEEG